MAKPSYFVVYFAFLYVLTTAFSKYICANDSSIICDEKCLSLREMMKKEAIVTSWKNRHPGIGRAYLEYNPKVAVEVGVARGELAAYLLHKMPDLEVHGVDPFIGGYDDIDGMSKDLKVLNASTSWAHAVLLNMNHFGCRYKHHLGMSVEMAKDFPCKTYIDI